MDEQFKSFNMTSARHILAISARPGIRPEPCARALSGLLLITP